MSIDISKALLIPGWMTEGELTWLAEAANDSTSIIEIGSWRGRSTRAMADNTHGMLLAVDTWADDAVGIPGWWTGAATEPPDGPDWLWKEFNRNLSDHIFSRVVPVRMSSKAAARDILGTRRFDMIFIDASHDTASVREDIELWRPQLAAGGKFCGHDYAHPLCPDVKPVVDEMVGAVKLCGTIWCA